MHVKECLESTAYLGATTWSIRFPFACLQSITDSSRHGASKNSVTEFINTAGAELACVFAEQAGRLEAGSRVQMQESSRAQDQEG